MAQETITAPTWRPAHRGHRALPPRWRKAVLALHVVMSVGWLGSAGTTIMLGLVAGMTSDPQLRYSAYVLLHDATLMVLLPCSMLGLFTGLALALLGPWRLVHHYWILTKFTLTLAAVLLAALYVSQRVTTAMALTSHGARIHLGSLGWQVVLGSAALTLILAINTTVAVAKPWGRTTWARTAAQR